MATVTWRGTAAKITEKYTETIGGTWADGTDTWTGTINGNDLVVTFGTGAADATTDIATAIVAAWNGATLPANVTVNVVGGGAAIPEFNEITASVSGSVVTFAHDTPGATFTMTSAKSSTSGTISLSNTVNATGPNDWANADNWVGGSVPTGSDDVIIDEPVSILYGLDQNAVTLASLTIGPRFTSAANIGLPDINANGYAEYRDKSLRISATALNINTGSGRVRINLGSVQTAAVVTATGTTLTPGLGAVQLLGTNASNTLRVDGGDVSVAAKPGEVSTIATLTQSGGTLVCGDGVTLTNVTKTAGTTTIASSTTTLDSRSGTTYLTGGTHGTLTVGDGTCAASGATTITALKQASGSTTVGPACTLTAADKASGTLTSQVGVGTLVSDAGTTTIAAGNITSATINGGTFVYGGTGTITALSWANCTLDFNAGTSAACTITTLNAPVGNCTFKDAADRVTITNGFPTPVGTTTIRVA